MQRILFAASLAAAIATGPAAAWAGPFTADPPVTVSGGTSPFADCTADNVADQMARNGGMVVPNSEVEPWVDVNPTNPLNIVGAFQQDRWTTVGGARGLVAGVSFDGGETWEQIVIPGISLCSGGTFERATDPWLSFAPNGDLYHISLSFDTLLPPKKPGGDGRDAMLVSKSTDGGRTWSAPVTLLEDADPKFLNDKQAITADPGDARFVYAVWDRLQFPNGVVINPEHARGVGSGPTLFTRTTDGGQTWEPVRIIYNPGSNNSTIGNQIVVLPDGTLVNVLNDTLTNKQNGGGVKFTCFLSVMRSTDKGARWARPIRVTKMQTRACIEPFDGVTDPDTGAPIRTGDIIPQVAVDRSPGSPGYGSLYLVWQDARFSGGDHDGIAFSRSRDGGFTWSAPVQVNVVAPQAAAFTPVVKVAADGTIGVTYYDFRNNTPDTNSLPTDAFLIHSHDQGVTWGNEVRLTPTSFDMLKAPFARGFFVGDYVGLGVAGNDFKPFFSVSTDSDPANVISTTVGP